jgi:hypothetical protein
LTAKRGDNVHINYTGTDVNNPRDILSDVAFAVGYKVRINNFQTEEKRHET